MPITTLSDRLPLPSKALLFDLEDLSRCLQRVANLRDGRGLRYPLASLLMIGVLAKLAGQESLRAIAHWAQLRQGELSALFHLRRERMPHSSTWSRVLGHGVDPVQLEQVLGQFFAAGVSRGAQPQRASREIFSLPTLQQPCPYDHNIAKFCLTC